MPDNLGLSQARAERRGIQTSHAHRVSTYDEGAHGEVRCEALDYGRSLMAFPMKSFADNNQIHNPEETRRLMEQLVDTQMANIADYDCFSQVVFESVDHYKMMKNDPFYRKHLFDDHEKFADTRRSK